jgi:hypothetical protein
MVANPNGNPSIVKVTSGTLERIHEQASLIKGFLDVKNNSKANLPEKQVEIYKAKLVTLSELRAKAESKLLALTGARNTMQPAEVEKVIVKELESINNEASIIKGFLGVKNNEKVD